MSDILDPPDRRSLGGTFKRIIRRLIMPSNAISGQTRMVWGADTPPELQAYGITVAMLAYVTDFTTGIEVGYFFMGVSNQMDSPPSRAMVYGNVTYPTPGVPGSATVANVKTNFQQDMAAQFPFTIFKDHNVEFWGIISRWYSPNHTSRAEIQSSNILPMAISAYAVGGTLGQMTLNFDQLYYGARRAVQGSVGWSNFNGPFGPVGVETVVLVSANIVWRNGFAYEVIVSGESVSTVVNGSAFVTIRRNNVGGPILAATNGPAMPIIGNSATIYKRWVIINNSGADITDRIVMTLQPVGGGQVSFAGGGFYSFLTYMDIKTLDGAATDYPNASQI